MESPAKKYHINNKGVPSVCRATSGNCPFGDNETHFNTYKDAQQYADKVNEEAHGLLATTKASKKVSKVAKNKKDLEILERKKNYLKNESSNETYIERCRSCKKLDDYVPKNKPSAHFLKHRKKRVNGLLKEFGKGNLVGYYEIDQLDSDSRIAEPKYKKQIAEIRDNGIITLYDYKNGKTITTFLPHRARTETMLVLAGEIPTNDFLKTITQNKKKVYKLRLDN